MSDPRTYTNNIVLNADRACKEILKRRDVNNPFYQFWNGRLTAAQDIMRAFRQEDEAREAKPRKKGRA